MPKSIFNKLKQNHSLLMAICCAIPLVLIVMLSSFGVLESWGYYALILLCPILHLAMHSKGHGSHCNKEISKKKHNQIMEVKK